MKNTDFQRCSLSIFIMLLCTMQSLRLNTIQISPLCLKNNIYIASKGNIQSFTVNGASIPINGNQLGLNTEKWIVAQLWYGDEIAIKTSNSEGIVAVRKCFHVSQNESIWLTTPFDWKCNDKVPITVPFISQFQNIPTGSYIGLSGQSVEMTCKTIYNPEPRKMGTLRFGIDDNHERIALNGFVIDMTGIPNTWNSIRSIDIPFREGDTIEITGTNDGGRGALKKPDQVNDAAFIAVQLTYFNNRGSSNVIYSNEDWICNDSKPQILNFQGHPAYSGLKDLKVKAIWDSKKSERSKCVYTSSPGGRLARPNEPIDPPPVSPVDSINLRSPFECNN